MKPKSEYFLNLLVFPYDPLLGASGKKEISKVFNKLTQSISDIKKYAEILSDKKWSLGFNMEEDEIYLSAFPPFSSYSRVEIEDELAKLGIEITNENVFIDCKEIEEDVSEETDLDFSDPFYI